MKITLLFSAVVLFSACYSQKPIQADLPANNQSYKVEYLFEHDGCKVYRFYDRGQFVYFTNCKGETITKNDSLAIKNITNRQ